MSNENEKNEDWSTTYRNYRGAYDQIEAKEKGGSGSGYNGNHASTLDSLNEETLPSNDNVKSTTYSSPSGTDPIIQLANIQNQMTNMFVSMKNNPKILTECKEKKKAIEFAKKINDSLLVLRRIIGG